jgi:eukaryotic-like serine/threonine-protein kinase
MLAPDETIGDGRYRLLRKLGAGGMASVWLARDDRLNRDVAVKVISDSLADDPAWLTRFEREARAAAAVSHPNVVSIFDYNVQSERPYLVMSYIDGPSLAGALADGAQVDGERLAHELLDAVAHVHAAGIVHRDITPGNVLLDDGGHAHLTDFGIAQFPEATALTQTGMVIGTRNYLAPEVVAGQPATTASDLYSVGRVLEEVALRTNGTGHLTAVIEALTAENPSRRPASAQAAMHLTADESERRTVARTAPTRVMPRQRTRARARVPVMPTHRTRPRARAPDMPTHGTRARVPVVPAALAAAVALLVIVILIASSGGGAGKPTRPDIVAPTAPLNAQLAALDAAVDRAAAGH